MTGEQADFFGIHMHGVYGNEAGTQQAEFLKPCQRPHAMTGAAVLQFLRRFVQMNMHGNIEFAGISGDLRECGVADRKRRMRRQTK